jgi:hypothetical protein
MDMAMGMVSARKPVILGISNRTGAVTRNKTTIRIPGAG